MWPQIAILVLSTLISHARRPKQPKVQPAKVETPEAKEGKPIRKIYGTVWIKDPQVLGFKTMGTDAIRTKGSKK